MIIKGRVENVQLLMPRKKEKIILKKKNRKEFP